MTPRERNLAIFLSGLVVLAVGFVGYMFLLQPLQANASAEENLKKEVAELEKKADQLKAVRAKLDSAKIRSLPADTYTARREYGVMLTRLLAKANIPQSVTTVKEKTTNDIRGIPQLANKKLAYTRVVYDVHFKNVDMWAVTDFLSAYYDLNLLHQITSITIKDESNGSSRRAPDRKDLTVELTTEAIIVDGADNRPTLLPIPSGFAAVGGWPGYDAIAFNPDPEPARRINPFQHAPVLATKKRDYSFIVLRDMFHGPLPPPPAPAIGSISEVTARVGAPIPPVKLEVTGDVPPGPVVWTASPSLLAGQLLPSGSVKIDPEKQTISITPAEGETGSGTINLQAILANGTKLEGSFKITVTAPPAKTDISAHVKLLYTTTSSDGTGQAVIYDQYTPHNYKIDATIKGVEVQKFKYAKSTKGVVKDTDGDPSPLLVISAADTGTDRTFRIIAVDTQGLILIDLTPPPAKPGAAPVKGVFGPGKGPGGPGKGEFGAGKGAGKFPPRKPNPDPMTVPPGPLAAAVGVPATAVPGEPKLYRWAAGKTLQELIEVPRSEAKLILERVEKHGPVGSTNGMALVPGPTNIPVAPPPIVKAGGQE